MPMVARGFNHYIKKSTNGCWHWTGMISTIGYGYASVNRSPKLAHRLAYEQHHGITLEPRGHPDHRQVDHLCHNRSKSCPGGPECLHRRCVNPAHLALVTAAENTEASARTPAHQNRHKTHCKNGHEFTPENTRIRNRPGGGRQCKRCQAINCTRRRRELRADT